MRVHSSWPVLLVKYVMDEITKRGTSNHTRSHSLTLWHLFSFASHCTRHVQAAMLAAELSALESKPNFSSRICEAFTLAMSTQGRSRKRRITSDFLSGVCKSAKLGFNAQLLIGLSLAQSEDQAVAQVFNSVRSRIL